MATKIITPIRSVYRKDPDLWDRYIFPIGLPIFLAVVLGVLQGYLISSNNWLFIFVVPFLIPIGLLFLKYPFVAIILWMMILPFFPPHPNTRILYWIFHRAMIPGILGLLILGRMFKLKKYPEVHLGWPDLSLLLYLGIVVISILFYAPPGNWFNMFTTLMDRTTVAFFAYWFVRFLQPDPEDWQRLILPYMLIFFVAESIIGLISGFSPHSLPEIWLNRQAVGDRNTGTFSSPPDYTSTLMWLMLFLLHYGMSRGTKNLKLMASLLFGLGLVCIFLSFNRASWLCALLVLIPLLFAYPKSIALLVILLVPTMIILTATVPAMADQVAFGYERLTGEAGRNSAEARVTVNDAGLQMFMEKPILGWGYAQYDLYDWEFMRVVNGIAPSRWAIEEGTSHNTYITVLAETGLVGFILYYFPFLWWLVGTVKIWPMLHKSGFWSRKFLLIVWLAIAFRLLVSQTTDQRFSWYSTTMLWLLLGIVANMVITQSLRRDNEGESSLTPHV